ncbi:MAG: hypothetical protein RL397_1717 [Pseudomonadota bacterium]|jgi:thiol-disulfide isomerase/thioredoxin
MNPFFKKHGLFIVSFLVIWAGIQIWQTRSVPSGPPPADALSAALPLISGASIVEDQSLEQALVSLREKYPQTPIVIHIWAEWCGFCKLEESSITTLASEHPVLTIAMQSGPPEKVQRYLEDRALPWTTLVDRQGQVAQALGASGVPAFMVLDENGHLRVPTMGYTTLWGMRMRLWWAMSGFFSSSS